MDPASELGLLFAFANTGPGRQAVAALTMDNIAAYPHLAENLRGIALGAGVNETSIWLLNLMPELENLMPFSRTEPKITPSRRVGHCSDVYSRDSAQNVILAHNEDWRYSSLLIPS